MTCAAWAVTAALFIVPVAAQEAREATAPSVTVQLIAVRATSQGHEKPQFDASIASIRETVEDLKQFDDFRKLKTVNTVAPYGRETKVPLDNQYTLLLNPSSGPLMTASAAMCACRCACRTRKTSRTPRPTHRRPSPGTKRFSAAPCSPCPENRSRWAD